MIKPVILDSGPLGRIAHPRVNAEVAAWFQGLLARGVEIILPEISDYELRREFLHLEMVKSIRRLDELKTALRYLPLTTQTMLRAAELWASARKQGKSTADPHALDGDVILAAQAEQAGAIVATENVDHLSLFVEARTWRQIQ